MLLIPAIDLKGGKCVRLIQGQKGREIVYGDDPVAWALRWVEQGAQRLHLIDLDGAFDGAPAHIDVLAQVAEAVDVPVEFGGGVRTEASLAAVLEAGASFIILGTSALRNPQFLESAARKHPGKILLGIDARDGEVRISGWEEGRFGIARIAGEPLRPSSTGGNHLHRHQARRHAGGFRPRPHRRARPGLRSARHRRRGG